MRQTLALALLLLSPLPSQAQALREVPEAQPVEAELSSSILASMGQDEMLQGIRRWEGNLVGDPTPDYLVEAFFSPVGGNAVYPRHWIFIASPERFESFFPLDLPGSILSAAIEGNALAITLSTYRDTDARCCPSGVEVVLLPLN